MFFVKFFLRVAYKNWRILTPKNAESDKQKTTGGERKDCRDGLRPYTHTRDEMQIMEIKNK